MKNLVFLVLMFCLSVPVFSQSSRSLWDLAKEGTAEEVRDAINSGRQFLLLNEWDKDGMTPLMYAATNDRNPDVVVVLLEAGSRIDEADKDGWTALIYTCYSSDSPEILSRLLRYRPNVRLSCSVGKTAFDYADRNPKINGTMEFSILFNEGLRQASNGY